MLLTASFGHIIPLRLLKLFPPIQRLNVHPSLLPRWRGAAPVQWTIANGDEETGVTVQTLVRYALGVDAGDILARAEGIVRIAPIVNHGEKDDIYVQFRKSLTTLNMKFSCLPWQRQEAIC